jgi:2Fe-2S ferredoxin
MPHVTFKLKNGGQEVVEAGIGESLMQTATMGGVAGIEAVCGGCCSCATCHVYVDEAWAAKLPAPGPDELEILETVAAERRPTSRLSCQISITAALDGLVVTMPDRQA